MSNLFEHCRTRVSSAKSKIRKVECRSKRQLDCAETEYLRRSQRYEKSSAMQIYWLLPRQKRVATSRRTAARQEGRQTTVRDRKKTMKISGISRTGRPFASSGKLRDTRMKRGDEIGRKAISFTSPDDFSEKSVSLGFERTTSNDDFSVQIRSRRQPRSHPPAPPRRHGLLRSLLQILLPRPVQFRVALGAGLDGRGHRAGRDALHLGKPRQTARRAVAQRVALYDRPQQGVRPHRPPAGPAARPPAVERALRRTFRIPVPSCRVCTTKRSPVCPNRRAASSR